MTVREDLIQIGPPTSNSLVDCVALSASARDEEGLRVMLGKAEKNRRAARIGTTLGFAMSIRR